MDYGVSYPFTKSMGGQESVSLKFAMGGANSSNWVYKYTI